MTDGDPTDRARHGGLHILLVEDDENLADVESALLESRGHTVRAVADGLSALAAAREGRYDVVLCDLTLGGELSGEGVADSLRAVDYSPRPIMVALSGRSRAEPGVATDAFAGVLSKPLRMADFDELLRRVHDVRRRRTGS